MPRPRAFLQAQLVEQFQADRAQHHVVLQEIENDLVEAAVADDVVPERFRGFLVVPPVVDLAVHALVLHLHPPRVARASIRFDRTFGLGGMALLLFLILAFTGLLLRFAYIPTPAEAYDSILVIRDGILFGKFIRNTVLMDGDQRNRAALPQEDRSEDGNRHADKPGAGPEPEPHRVAACAFFQRTCIGTAHMSHSLYYLSS